MEVGWELINILFGMRMPNRFQISQVSRLVFAYILLGTRKLLSCIELDTLIKDMLKFLAMIL
jgi:hypothetical protein